MSKKGIIFISAGIIIVLIIIILSMRSCKASPESLRNANARMQNEIQQLVSEKERLLKQNQEYENELRNARQQNDRADTQRDRLRRQNTVVLQGAPQREYERLQRENLQNQILIVRLRNENRQLRQNAPGQTPPDDRRNIAAINQLNNTNRDNNRLRTENKRLQDQIALLRSENARLRGTAPQTQQPVQNTQLNSEIEKLKKENYLLQQVNAELQRQIALTAQNNRSNSPQNTQSVEQLQRDNEQMRTQLVTVRQENDQLKQRNNTIQQDIERTNQRNTLIQQEIERLQRENAQLRNQAPGQNNDQANREIERLKRENTSFQQIIVQLREENKRLQSGQTPAAQQTPGTQPAADGQSGNDVIILKELITRLETQNQTMKTENDRLKQQNSSTEREIALLRQENERLKQQGSASSNPDLQRLRSENERLTQAYNTLKQQREQQRTAQAQPAAQTPAAGGPSQSDDDSTRLENTRLKQQIDKLTAEVERLRQQQGTPAQSGQTTPVNPEAARATHITNEKIKFLENEILDLRYQNRRLQLAAEAHNARQQRIVDLERQLALANDELRNLRERLRLLETQRVTIVQQAQQNNTTPDTRNLDSQIEQLKSEIARRTNENRQYQEEIARLKREMEAQRLAYTRMIDKLREDIQRGSIRTTVEGDKIRMIFLNEILFNTGAVTVSADGARILRIVGDALKTLQYGTLYIEGHTDNEPVTRQSLQNLYFQTNWEYSAVRATRIGRYMIANFNIPPQKIIAAGRSEYAPRESNATPRGKAMNRRIEILIAPETVVEANRNRHYRSSSGQTPPSSGTNTGGNNPPQSLNTGENPGQ